MDENVREKLGPVLRRGWAGLERLEVRGVSRRVLEGLEMEKELIGVEAVVEEEMDWAWECDGRDIGREGGSWEGMIGIIGGEWGIGCGEDYSFLLL